MSSAIRDISTTAYAMAIQQERHSSPVAAFIPETTMVKSQGGVRVSTSKEILASEGPGFELWRMTIPFQTVLPIIQWSTLPSF
jgi:hypothetical protein